MPARAAAAAPVASRKIDKLTTILKEEGSYDFWDTAIKDHFFGKGWMRMYQASEAKEGKDDESSDTDRAQAWTTITQSMEPEIRARVDEIPLGEVEALLMAIREQFYRNTIQTKSSLKNQLHDAKLEDHADLDTYIVHLKHVCKRLHGLGYEVDREDKVYYLLRGLPGDYEMVVQALKHGCSLTDLGEGGAQPS